jgi:hypothetical protein
MSTRGDRGEGRQGNFSFQMYTDDLCIDLLFFISFLDAMASLYLFAMNAAKTHKKLLWGMSLKYVPNFVKILA